MKKFLCFVLIFLVAGCQKSDIDVKNEVREYYENIKSFSADYEITTNLSDKSQIFDINFAYNKDDYDIITINAPESIKGISYRLSNSGTPELSFEGIRLETFIEENLGVSPSDVLSFSMRDLKEKEPMSFNVGDEIKLSYSYEKITKDIYLNLENYVIMRVEVFIDGEMITSANIKQ